MRLFTKIFLFGMLVFSVAFSASGYFLLHYSMESSMAREAEFALKQYQYDKFTVQSALLSYSDVSLIISIEDGSLSREGQTYTVWQTETDYSESLPGPDTKSLTESLFKCLTAEFTVPAAFFSEDKSVIYSEIQDLDPSFLDNLSEDAHIYQFRNDREGGSVLVGGILCWNGLNAGNPPASQDTLPARGGNLYFVTQWDISKTISQQKTLQQYFIRCYFAAVAAGMVLLGLLSAFLTGPLKRMSGAARRMAEGYYEERLPLKGNDEIGTLAQSFNRMAAAVEDKVDALSKTAREKEDFVANFAHELKTPLTSIIGYADTLYQKELSREEIRKASWHIWNEGMRLEALSLKLMELTVLGRQDFPLTEMPARELLEDTAESLYPLLQENQSAFCLRAQPAYVRADYDLLKTLLINLIDNAVKAGGTSITLSGQVQDGKYLISVEDNGCGMETEELSRITEAFYMVDKARSRKQHGAGLGLALAESIAKIHGSRLSFQSQKGQGTKVSFFLICTGKE